MELYSNIRPVCSNSVSTCDPQNRVLPAKLADSRSNTDTIADELGT